jgi:hypothetical protein
VFRQQRQQKAVENPKQNSILQNQPEKLADFLDSVHSVIGLWGDFIRIHKF